MDESEIYNIENYTERDLFEILDINNLLGCFFILCGVLLSQLLPLFKKRYS